MDSTVSSRRCSSPFEAITEDNSTPSENYEQFKSHLAKPHREITVRGLNTRDHDLQSGHFVMFGKTTLQKTDEACSSTLKPAEDINFTLNEILDISTGDDLDYEIIFENDFDLEGFEAIQDGEVEAHGKEDPDDPHKLNGRIIHYPVKVTFPGYWPPCSEHDYCDHLELFYVHHTDSRFYMNL